MPEHDEMTRKTGKTLLPKDFAPRGVICVIVTTQKMNALGQNLINIKHKESVVELKIIEQLVKWGLEGCLERKVCRFTLFSTRTTPLD